ncbi:protein adenylyltransferase SelO [Thiorhodovibrio frisius]|uniref:Protein nucleotidyltransferase YdiU n=1 Tax=Thiorhodovibrio frisius TaxID=631362 RepID=H8YX47_9GAMM|nr:YdiU family protein [Thiorhodovibrio frisius]EIC23023.1 hypothetical protein Thi970DRAFT_00672 [Thiorhodovibrio frisius]WPL22712.1 hypothetical protein Thiofri_02882 [Thiorhodovibrio frisius]
MIFAFDNSYARLPDRFHARVIPTAVAQPALLQVNEDFARQLGLNPSELHTQEATDIFAGNRLPEGAEPLAMAYAGHQFGSFVPQLGDGRAILLGERVTPDGVRVDIQLKGAGRTPFSRSGDGRACLGPVLREYLISEAMHAFGIPTTRGLAAVATGEPVYREHPLPGAILTRVASSHVRVGTFEYFRARQDSEALKTLADYVIARHFPALAETDQTYSGLLDAVATRQADLIAAWMSVGFIHGVMNTDNMSIVGETIDYGPCAFMDSYDPTTVFSSIDYRGRYAYGNQARIAHWNLSSLAMSLKPLLEQESDQAAARATAALDHFQARFDQAWLARFGCKLGLADAQSEDRALIKDFLDLLEQHQADFTNSFRALSSALEDGGDALAREVGQRDHGQACSPWLARWRERLAGDPLTDAERSQMMRQANPAVIPRNHRVEQALDAAEKGDMQPFERLLAVVREPWDDAKNNTGDDARDYAEISAFYQAPPKPQEVVQYTFCGT